MDVVERISIFFSSAELNISFTDIGSFLFSNLRMIATVSAIYLFMRIEFFVIHKFFFKMGFFRSIKDG